MRWNFVNNTPGELMFSLCSSSGHEVVSRNIGQCDIKRNYSTGCVRIHASTLLRVHRVDQHGATF
jgi:hypothetical protein